MQLKRDNSNWKKSKSAIKNVLILLKNLITLRATTIWCSIRTRKLSIHTS
jgi:hypothetical protein